MNNLSDVGKNNEREKKVHLFFTQMKPIICVFLLISILSKEYIFLNHIALLYAKPGNIINVLIQLSLSKILGPARQTKFFYLIPIIDSLPFMVTRV